MKRLLAGLIMLTMLVFGASSHAMTLPDQLTVIESEAFYGDTSLTGVLYLPESVKEIGANAFTGTGLYALYVPQGTVLLDTQTIDSAAYVYVQGAATEVSGLSGVDYVIAPAGSPAQIAAAAAGIDFVPAEHLIEAGNFFYNSDTGMLLSAKNASLVGQSVVIPAQVNDMDVTSVSPYAFTGCSALQKITLPEAVRGNLPESALASCPNAKVSYSSDMPVSVQDVSASVTDGPLGNSITWDVSVQAENGVANYLYSLARDGETIVTRKSSSSTFTYTADQTGSYQLTVDVTDRRGYTARGVSDALYIAAQALEMTAPETIEAGSNLVVSIADAKGAISYGLYLTNEETGESIGSRTLRKGGDITFSGYLMSPGVYRLSGYVYGNDFRYTVPTVKLVRVTGTQAEGPAIPELKPLIYNQSDTNIQLSDTEEFALRWQCRYSDGTMSVMSYTSAIGNRIWFGPSGTPEQWQTGGSMFIQGAIKKDGKWSAWGEVREIPVYPAPMLDQPVLTAPSTVEAGVDMNISFERVENGWDYSFNIYSGYVEGKEYFDEEDNIYSWGDPSGDTTLTVPGYLLAPGTYMLQLSVWAEGYESPVPVTQRLEVTGTRPAAPAVTADKAEIQLGERIKLSIQAPGSEGACIDTYIITEHNNWNFGESTVSLDENGCGSYFDSWSDEQFANSELIYKVYTIIDGKWSEPATVRAMLRERLPLASAEITAPAAIEAGSDFVFSFAAVENADSYSASVYRSYSQSSLYSWYSDIAPDQDIMLSGYRLSQGNYILKVTAESSEYGSSTAEFPFTVTGKKQAGPSVTVDKAMVGTQEYFTFEINSARAEALAYMIQDSDSSPSYGSITVLDDVTKWKLYEYYEGEYNFSFSALIDGKWTAWSTMIPINVSNSAVPVPTVSMPRTLALGEDLIVTAEGDSRITGYTIALSNSRGNQIQSRHPSGNSCAVTFGGYLMTPGIHKVKVTASSKNGSSTTEISVTVAAGTRPAAPSVVPETDLGRVNVSYGFTVATTSAEMAAVRYYRDGSTNNVYYDTFDVTGGSTIWTDSNGTADEVWNYAFAVKVNGAWSAWSTTSKVTITSREQLAKVSISAPESVEAGEDIYFTFTGVENADYYSLNMYRPDGSSYGKTVYPGVEQRFEGNNLNPGTYRIIIKANGANYDSSTSEKIIQVTGVRAAAPTVTVDVNSVFTNENFIFVIDTEGVDEVAYRYTAGSSSSSGTLNVLTDTTVWETSRSSSGIYNYSFCALKDGKWSAWSTPIQIQINSRPALAEPAFTMADTIAQGRNLTVTVHGADNASYYYVYLYNNRGNQVAYRYLSEPGSVVFSGYWLTPGSMRVEVEARNNDGGYSEAKKMFTVTSAALPAPVSVTPPESLTVSSQTYFYFSLDTQGAEKAAVRYYRVGAPNDVSYSEFNVSGAATTSWRDYHYNKGITYAYSFSVLVDGVWSQWSSFTEINIE